MKKLLSLLLAVVTLLAACGVPGEVPDLTDADPTVSGANVPETTVPETVIPETTTAAPAQYITYSPYPVSGSAMTYLGEDYSLYCDVIDAILAYDETVSGFTDEAQFRRVWEILMKEWAPGPKLCADTPAYSGGTVTLGFLNDQAEHARLLEQYEEKLNTALAQIKPEDSEVEIIEKLLYYVSHTMTYDYAHAYPALYDGIMANRGICSGFSGYFDLLLRNAGIESMIVSCVDTNDHDMDHAWVVAKMDGVYYHFDPTWESSNFAPWTWFGLSDEARIKTMDPAWTTVVATGGDPLSDELTAEGIIFYGPWDYTASDYGPLPECPELYRVETRDPDKLPSQW